MDAYEGLTRLGLSEKEARVYYDLIEHGESSAGKITYRVKFHRRNVYDALQGLSSKGLVTGVVKGGTRLFSATPAESLRTIVREKEMILSELLPVLEKKQDRKSGEPSVVVYQGKEGLKTIHEDILKENRDYLIYGGSVQAAAVLGDYFNLWNKKRVRRGLKIQGIWIDTPEVRSKLAAMPLVEPKFIPKEHFSHVVWWLYADKLVLVLYREEPIAVVIESEDFARTYRNFFKLMWRVARK